MAAELSAAAVAACTQAAGRDTSEPEVPTKIATRDGGRSALRLQALSTRCALVGSAAAVMDAATQDFAVQGPSSLALLAVAGLSTSVVLEVAALHLRGQARRVGVTTLLPSPVAAEQVENVAAAAASAPKDEGTPRRLVEEPPWRSVLLVLALASLAMGCFTALGAGVAKNLGIVPRTWGGLPGIFVGCFVHLSWRHCGYNALALFLLGPCVLRAAAPPAGQPAAGAGTGGDEEAERAARGGIVRFIAASAFISLTSSFFVWCLARPALHAGASGVVWGYVGLLVALTLRRRDVPFGSLLLVLVVAACYGSSVLRAGLRNRAGASHHGLLLYEACKSQTMSAEHHTFGFLSGLASVLFFCRPRPRVVPQATIGFQPYS